MIGEDHDRRGGRDGNAVVSKMFEAFDNGEELLISDIVV
jgi:hypothetical protein